MDALSLRCSFTDIWLETNANRNVTSAAVYLMSVFIRSAYSAWFYSLHHTDIFPSLCTPISRVLSVVFFVFFASSILHSCTTVTK